MKGQQIDQGRWSIWKCNDDVWIECQFPLTWKVMWSWSESPRPWVSSCPWGLPCFPVFPEQSSVLVGYFFVVFIPSKCLGCFHFGCLNCYTPLCQVNSGGAYWKSIPVQDTSDCVGVVRPLWSLWYPMNSGRLWDDEAIVCSWHPWAARREKLYGTRWRLSLPPHRLRAWPSRHWKHIMGSTL